MKRRINLAQTSRAMFLISLIFFACLTAARAAVTARVCVDAPYRSGTVALVSDAAAGTFAISVNGDVPPYVSLVINPGGTNQEIVPYMLISSNGLLLFKENGFSVYNLNFAHTAGETVTFAGYSGTAYFGYNNTGSTRVTIPRAFSTNNYFFPGPSSYQGQPAQFDPGIHENVVSLPVGPLQHTEVTWVLQNSSATANLSAPKCEKITYQGRLTDGSSAANGVYDLQFTAYDSLTGGIVQSDKIPVEDVPVTNGIFTAQLNFYTAFANNNNARFLEIAVRTGTSTGAFTTLAPRQPLTSVPFAVNAENARKAFDVQLILTTDAPLYTDCNSPGEYGQMRADAVNNKLWVCMATGWKAFVPQ